MSVWWPRILLQLLVVSGAFLLENLLAHFSCLVRFGDQILQVNGDNVAGYSTEKVHDILKKASVNNISMVIRDRPFERTLTLHKVKILRSLLSQICLT